MGFEVSAFNNDFVNDVSNKAEHYSFISIRCCSRSFGANTLEIN